jgi:hypothetical protein
MSRKHPCRAMRLDCPANNADRRGFILLVVTVIIILLSLAAYGYLNSMATEHAAAAMFGRDVEARMAAESAVEFAACQIALKETDPSIDVYHNPGTFRNQAMNETDNPRGQVRFSIVVPDINGATAGMPRSGLNSENAKFNINRLMEFENDTDDTTDPYMAVSYIPNMTEDITNAILDWIDSDEEARLGGAESVTYQGLAVPYSARNAPLESIDELLQIQGITPQLFYGEDANRNGVLDPNEDDGAEKSPADDADGVLDAGFRDYLTVSSRERNTLPGGDKKININNGIVAEMYDFLEEEFDTETATFITAYRMKGDQNADSEAQGKLTIEQQQLVDWIAKNISNGELGQVTRGGMDLSEPPTAQFRSIYDLIDAKVEIEINGGLVTLTSPWTSDAGSLLESMPILESKLTVLNDEFIDGRININQAPKEILMAMPDITEKIASQSRNFQLPLINKPTTIGRLHIGHNQTHQTSDHRKDQQSISSESITDAKQRCCGPGQRSIAFHLLEHRGEVWNNPHHHRSHNQESDDEQEHRVNHCPGYFPF